MITGLWLHPNERTSDLLTSIEDLEASGIDQIWLGDEGVSRDPFALLAAAAVRTDTIELAIGVTNPVLRHPGIVASAASTIAELSSDRFILGWGSGGDESLGPFGLHTHQPVQLVEHAVDLCKSVLEGQSTIEYSPPRHATPARSVRQYVGARGPRLIALASRIADGIFLSGVPDDALADAISLARSIRPIQVALYQTIRVSGSESPGVWTGSAPSIAGRLRTLAERFNPTSIGIACIDDMPLQRRVAHAIDVLDRMRA